MTNFIIFVYVKIVSSDRLCTAQKYVGGLEGVTNRRRAREKSKRRVKFRGPLHHGTRLKSHRLSHFVNGSDKNFATLQ